jgi:hypothetical protein
MREMRDAGDSIYFRRMVPYNLVLHRNASGQYQFAVPNLGSTKSWRVNRRVGVNASDCTHFTVSKMHFSLRSKIIAVIVRCSVFPIEVLDIRSIEALPPSYV